METKCHEFVETLINQSEGLREAYNKAIEYWSPDEPPVTTLFEALGDRVVEEFDQVDQDENQRIFSLIESAMASGNTSLMTAVATGLIEAIVAMSHREEDKWQRISPMLGELSRNHAFAWIGT